jgi:hypothetical protein
VDYRKYTARKAVKIFRWSFGGLMSVFSCATSAEEPELTNMDAYDAIILTTALVRRVKII